MKVKALLDIDLVALESTEKVTMMLDMTAPITGAAISRARLRCVTDIYPK